MTGLRDVCQAFRGIKPAVSRLNCQTLQLSASFPNRESLNEVWQRLHGLNLVPSSRENQLTVIVGTFPREIKEAESEFPWLASAN
jgi:hypothetical protein